MSYKNTKVLKNLANFLALFGVFAFAASVVILMSKLTKEKY
jgi:hypothetical protein